MLQFGSWFNFFMQAFGQRGEIDANPPGPSAWKPPRSFPLCFGRETLKASFRYAMDSMDFSVENTGIVCCCSRHLLIWQGMPMENDALW